MKEVWNQKDISKMLVYHTLLHYGNKKISLKTHNKDISVGSLVVKVLMNIILTRVLFYESQCLTTQCDFFPPTFILIGVVIMAYIITQLQQIVYMLYQLYSWVWTHQFLLINQLPSKPQDKLYRSTKSYMSGKHFRYYQGENESSHSI